DVLGFGPWSIKTGVTHVEPPFEVVARMITIRVHLNDCETNNAPPAGRAGLTSARAHSGQASRRDCAASPPPPLLCRRWRCLGLRDTDCACLGARSYPRTAPRAAGRLCR